ncbi:MAG TPA: DUF2783 domain-containing protein [Beijerinckiaceae bacterium]|nr:DUF2783 domain-containing protein [Beijerinckiaceae bacterium]
MKLTTRANINDPDGFYQELIEAQRDLGDEEAARMTCKLVILLANHIGDRAVLSEALRLAAPKSAAIPPKA